MPSPKTKITSFKSLQNAIFSYFRELHDTQKAVLFALQVAQGTPDSKLKDKYTADAQAMQAMFKRECTAFLKTLDRYIELEKRKKCPTNFQIRKVRQSIMESLK